MSKLINIRVGSHVASLVVAVMFLMAVSVKADYVSTVLSNVQGTHTSSFATPGGYIQGNRYTYSEKFTLADAGWFFTSFTLNPEKVTLAIQSMITNGWQGSAPQVDLSGSYTGEAKWTGQIVIKSGDLELFRTGVENFTETVEGMTYTPSIIEGGIDGGAKTDWFDVDFTKLLGLEVNLGEDILKGAKEIEFDFILTEISFDNLDFDMKEVAGTTEGWEGRVNGSISMTYDTSSNSTPEPASMLIFGLGTAGAGLVSYRKRRGRK